MRLAIFSDVHSNIRAFEAVLDDLSRNGGADKIYCLGDVIGYGPKPNDCLALAKQHFAMTLRGNHEHALINGAKDFNEMALRAINWTRDQIIPDYEHATAEQMENWAFVNNTLERHVEGSLQFVHGAPQDPIDEYILPMDIDPVGRRYGPKLERAFSMTPWLTFCGHSHFPALYSEDGTYVSPTFQKEVRLVLERQRKHIVNVGSVGQPRDGDNRACYAVFENGVITWRRIHYDIQDTYNQVYAIGPAALDPVLGERLFRGE
jgi:diadenosine tetraphosphatase ApaH/serine/threonine PP2A family protein phosphatase